MNGAQPSDFDADWLLEAAAVLCGSAGLAPPDRMARLAGGKNNQVFRLDAADGPFVLKRYFRHPGDRRDRLEAEWRFSTFVWSRGVRTIPRPIAHDRHAGLGLYAFVDGRKPAATDVTTNHIDLAASFICAINREPKDSNALGYASEACFSIGDHLQLIERRVARLADIDGSTPMARSARAFCEDRLRPQWNHVSRRVAADCDAAGVDMSVKIADDEIIASPSDFGFHNIFEVGARDLVFFDFEYAGWDDPAKLICDLFSNPEIPLPDKHFARFADRICEGLGLPRAVRLRATMLHNAYRIKWACIVLNDFLTRDAARRDFASRERQAIRQAAQFQKAVDILNRLNLG